MSPHGTDQVGLNAVLPEEIDWKPCPDRVYTVISSVLGLGERFDSEKLHAYQPGSVVVLPGDLPHFHDH